MSAPSPVVAICVPIAAHPKAQFMISYDNLRIPRSSDSDPEYRGVTHKVPAPGYSPITVARRMISFAALTMQPPAEWFLWIDDDMVFDSESLRMLLRTACELHAKDPKAGYIVGGLCFNRRAPSYQPTIFRKTDPSWAMAQAYGHCYDYAKNQVVECDATGAGFLLVHREVMEAFPDGDWWEQKQLGGDRGASHTMLAEDLSFCEKAKAKGYKIHVDARVKIGHVADVVIDEETSARLRTEEWQRWNPSLTVARMATGAPLASVIIPTFNQRPEFLRAAVLSAIHQTVPVEVIVVDDGSSGALLVDKVLADVRSDGRLRIVGDGQNHGIAAALNRGIEEMLTPWFCWLSSDDTFDPRKVDLQLASMDQATAMVGFHRYWVHQNGTRGFGRYAISPNWRTLEDQQRILARGCAINGSTVMIHRDVFAIVGRFDMEYRYGQDWEMWNRISAHGYLWHETALQLGMRREGGNLTQEIAKEPVDAERRRRRDFEDVMIRTRYAPKCPGCGVAQP